MPNTFPKARVIKSMPCAKSFFCVKKAVYVAEDMSEMQYVFTLAPYHLKNT